MIIRKDGEDMLILDVINILRKYSSEESPMTQSDILDKLEQDRSIRPDRKTLRSALNELSKSFGGIHHTENSRKGWYIENILTKEEQSSVIKAMLFCPEITRAELTEISEKLSPNTNIATRYKNIVRPKFRSPDIDISETLDIILRGIRERLMLTFSLCIRRCGGVTELERENDGYVREYLVRPISVLAHNGSFSLLGSLGDSAKMKFFPLDKIYGARISDVECRIMPHFPEGSPIYPENIAEERFPRGGARSEIKVKANREALFELCKTFENVVVQCIGESLFEVTFTCNLSSARRYLISLGEGVEVISPHSLRGEVAGTYFRMAERYRR